MIHRISATASILAAVLMSFPAHGATVGDLIPFNRGTTINSADMNSNFDKLKSAVNDNAARITAIETKPLSAAGPHGVMQIVASPPGPMPNCPTGWTSAAQSATAQPSGVQNSVRTCVIANRSCTVFSISYVAPNVVQTCPAGFMDAIGQSSYEVAPGVRNNYRICYACN